MAFLVALSKRARHRCRLVQTAECTGRCIGVAPVHMCWPRCALPQHMPPRAHIRLSRTTMTAKQGLGSAPVLVAPKTKITLASRAHLVATRKKETDLLHGSRHNAPQQVVHSIIHTNMGHLLAWLELFAGSAAL